MNLLSLWSKKIYHMVRWLALYFKYFCHNFSIWKVIFEKLETQYKFRQNHKFYSCNSNSLFENQNIPFQKEFLLTLLLKDGTLQKKRLFSPREVFNIFFCSCSRLFHLWTVRKPFIKIIFHLIFGLWFGEKIFR